MRDIVKKFSNSIIIVSILSIILGLIFIVYPDTSMKTIGTIIALYMIVQGIVLCIFDFQTRNIPLPIDSLFSGILSIILGIIIMMYPTSIATLVTIILGIYILASSINYIRLSIELKDEDIPWILMLIIGILDLIAGFIIIFNPFEASISLAIFIGIILIVNAICNIIDTLTLRNNIKKIKKYFED